MISRSSDDWSLDWPPQNVMRMDAEYVAGGGTCSRIDRTRELNPSLLPVSGSKTGKSLLTHFHTLCPPSVRRAEVAPLRYLAGTGTLKLKSRILKKSDG